MATPSEVSAQGAPTSVGPLPPVLNGDDRWGFNAIYADSQWVLLARNAGARWNRWVFAWDAIQPVRGQPQYTTFDEVVATSRQAGFSIDAVLIGLPGWAKDQRTQLPSGLYLAWNDPQNFWAQFVKQTVTRYKGQIRHWEIWNEPDDSQVSWAGSAADYYQLLKVSYLAVKSVDPSAQVILAGLAYWTNPQFLPDLLRIMVNDLGARPNQYYFDILALHAYVRPSDVPDRVTWARAHLSTTVGDRPIWLNETNVPAWNVSGSNRFLPFQWSATTSEQASYIIQAFAQAVAAGVEKVMVYRFHNVGEPTNYALVDSDGALFPGYVAYQVAARYFSQASAATIGRQGDVEQVVLRRPNERVTVLWNRSPSSVSTRVGAQALTATAVDQAGATRSLQATAGQYQLDLRPATANKGLTGTDFVIGGQPLILVETLPASQQSARLLSPLISYAGDWSFVPAAGASGGSVRRTTTASAGAAVGFEGETVTWTTTKGPDRGIARITIDGLLQAEIDLYSPTVVQQVPLTFGPFASGRHRLIITATGRRATASNGTAVEIDSISSTSLFATQPPPAPSPTATPTSTPAPVVSPTPSAIPANARPQVALYEAVPTAATRVAIPFAARLAGGWTTLIALQNRVEKQAALRVRFLEGTGQAVTTVDLTLPPNGSLLLDPRSVPALPNGYTGSAMVTSSDPIAVAVIEDHGIFDAAAYAPPVAGADRAYVPLVLNQYDGWETDLQVLNLGDGDVPVIVTYRSPTERDPWKETAEVPGQSVARLGRPESGLLPQGFAGTALVQASEDAQIIALVSGAQSQRGGMSYVAPPRGTPTVALPLIFKRGNGWSTTFAVHNLGAEDTDVTVDFQASDGSGSWEEQTTLAAGDTATFSQIDDTDMPDGFIGSAVITSTNGQPLVAVVTAVHRDPDLATIYLGLLGQAADLSAPFLARDADGWTTTVRVQNLGDASADIALVLRSQDGQIAQRVGAVVAAGAAHTFDLGAIDRLPRGWRGSGVVSASDGKRLGALITQTRYWPAS